MNRTAIVTGASRGIGAAVAEKLASEGVGIAAVCAGNVEPAEAVCATCRGYGVPAKSYRCDVSDPDAAKDLVSRVKADFGGIDILVNNAGITRDGLILTMRVEDFDAVIATNLKGTFNMIRSCAGVFLRRRYGRIVNISSVAGLTGNAGQGNYAASKAGVIGLTKSVARELASRGITCNAVAPGFIDTDMTRSLPQSPEDLAKNIPLGRFGLPEEVAQAVSFLIGADYITGEVLRVDGGMAM